MIEAPAIHLQPVSVTRQMAAALPELRAIAESKGLRLHHLGAGYPHPEVSDPRTYTRRREEHLKWLASRGTDPDRTMRELMLSIFGYTDTLGPAETREAFARVYGADFGLAMKPDNLVPTVGSTGGIALMCSIFERAGEPVAYIVDAPTYTGFVSRAGLYDKARFYSVELDEAGPDPEHLRAQVRRARADGLQVAFYYTVPDGHNPAGISFSQERREAIVEVARDEGLLIVEDAPYTYISYEPPEKRPAPLVALDAEHVVHLFTASKIGLPGPRVAFAYTEARLKVGGGAEAALRDLLITEAAADILFQNPAALRGFEAYLYDEDHRRRETLWPVAERKTRVYGENRAILLDGLERGLGEFGDRFHWTRPGAGFFSVFTFRDGRIRTDADFVARLVREFGVVTVPMFGFYTADARERNPDVGLDQLRLSFSYSERIGEGRREDMRLAVDAFCDAVRAVCELPRR